MVSSTETTERQRELDGLLDGVDREAGPRGVQTRTLTGMRIVLSELGKGVSHSDASKAAGVLDTTVREWRRRYPKFGLAVAEQLAENKRVRTAKVVEEKKRRRVASRLIVDRDAETPDRGGLAEFRMKYFGRPTLTHQELIVEALEDYTNLYVFVLGPPGMGKDTLAGDYCAFESAPDRSGKTVAWFMESSDFSERRFARLESYLIDPKAYEKTPSKTPGGQIPSGSLIDDYGPFKWKPKMEWPDGTPVQKKKWTAHAKYFVQVDAPEQDPNLWATGMGGATYGSRIKICVCSDVFTLENQQSPTERVSSYNWLSSTLDTRLDDDGRLVVIGTMLDIENNYERMIEDYTAGARVVSEKRVASSRLTKYSNGVCLVVVEAVWTNPETGEDESFWPDMFPLYDVLEHRNGKLAWNPDDLTTQKLEEVMANPHVRMRRGLLGRRQRMGAGFEAMYQQRRIQDSDSDFDDEAFEAAKDPERSFGQVYAHELKIVGVDPARTYGAGWGLLAVDRKEQTMTVADIYYGTNLGYEGMKQQLVVNPITRWEPMWYCFESNRHGGMLEDALIADFISGSGVSVFTEPTGADRNHPLIGPAGLAAYMRAGQLKIPYKNADDRKKFELIKNHFKAWVRHTSDTRRMTRPGQPGHEPDDLTFAIWMASKKAIPLLDTQRKDLGVTMAMPKTIARRYQRTMADLSSRAQERHYEKTGRRRVRAPNVSAAEALEELFGGSDSV